MLQKIRTQSGVTEYVLPQNGLRVLHKQDNSAPLVGVMVTYHVGSRNEAVGHTGSTHILEHLLFKDSKNFNTKNGKPPSKYLERLGASMNATTWLDRTNYFELMPKENAEQAIALEADRMRYSQFSAADLKTEMTVVRNEYERGRNNPEELLDEAVWATAFMSHPYHHPTIGWKDDIEGSTVEKLREFYDRFYYPNNATLSLFGALSKKEMEALVLKYFTKLPQAPTGIPHVHTKEGEQTGARRVEIENDGETSLVTLAHKAPAATDPQFPIFLLISQILGGGLASRLQRALVDTGKAVYVNTMMHGFHDPSLIQVTSQATPSNTPAQLLEIIRGEYEKFKKAGPTAEELSRAKEQIKAILSYSRDGILSELFALNEAIAGGDWTSIYTMEGAIQKVALQDVHRIAREALIPQKETVGILRPKKN